MVTATFAGGAVIITPLFERVKLSISPIACHWEKSSVELVKRRKKIMQNNRLKKERGVSIGISRISVIRICLSETVSKRVMNKLNIIGASQTRDPFTG
jgi:beta-lactamase regulating signal transducer with metallopeptidase domain